LNVWSNRVEVKLEFDDIVYLGIRSLREPESKTEFGGDSEVKP
jgi:hypothetical protein